MSEQQQPFTEYVTRAKRAKNSARPAWITVGIMGALLITVLLLWAGAVGRLRGLEALPAKLDEANASLASALAENQKAKDQITALQTQVGRFGEGKGHGRPDGQRSRGRNALRP